MLPRRFKPTATYNLIRLGKDHDGGYLVEKESLVEAKQLLSFGLGRDWSFEEDFLKKNSVPLLAYDGTLKPEYLIKSVIKNLLFLRFYKFFSDIHIWLNYRSFFTKNRIHRRINVDYDSKQTVSLATILEKEKLELPIFIKMDIEGSEYRLLSDILKHASDISGLVVEFHDVDLHRDRILDFIQKLPLTLVHIHGNNFRPINKSVGPTVLEFTFARAPKKLSDKITVPHPLDQENNPSAEYMELKFK